MPKGNGNSHKRRVLLIDDEKNLTQMLAMILETRGYLVDVANTATEGMAKVNGAIDLIILDLVLPDIDGFKVCQKLKEDESTRHIPIIMLSAHSLHEDKVEGLYLGADDFLSKPCESEELLARMEVVMRRGPLQKEGIPSNGKDDLVHELRKILDEALIVPYYQPIYSFEPFKMMGLEILTRPNTATTLSNPESFFNKALECGMYTDIELLAWTLALKPLAKYLTVEKVFLNCNPYFIETSQFARVKAVFEKNNIPFENAVLEITERSAITNFELFQEQLKRYRDLGFHVAIDDVGGGYSSLESIVALKPEVVKIDRHIVMDLGNNTFKQSIVKFIASLCREHNITCIAEGIETQEDLNLVKDLGVSAVQGFYLYRPTDKVNWTDFGKVDPAKLTD